MLKKAGFGLLMLLMVCAALDPLPQEFPRPWNSVYKWPANASVVDYTFSPPLFPRWNMYALQGALDGLAVGSVTDGSGQSATNAENNYTQSKIIFGQADEFANYGFVPYVFNADDACRQLEVANCACIVSGNVLTCNADTTREMRYYLAKLWLSKDYSAAWKGTVDNALDALEGRASALNGAMLELENAYEEASRTGACDQDVAGYQACENASLFLAAANGADSTLAYADFGKIRTALENDTVRAWDDVPILSYGWAMNSMGNQSQGAIMEAGEIDAALLSHLNRTEARYAALSAEASAALAEAEATNASANANEIWRIRASPAFDGIVGEDFGSAGKNSESGNADLAAAYAARDSAAIAYAAQDPGYLREAIAGMGAAKSLAKQSNAELQAALAGSKAAVSDYEKAAKEHMSRVESKFGAASWPRKAEALFGAANQSFAQGLAETSMGKKFELYVSAIKNADEAYAVSPGNEPDTNWSAIAACSEASELMPRAAADGIDTASERAMLLLLSRSGDAGALVTDCNGITQSVIESARYKYSFLEGQRAQAITLLDACGADCDDVRAATNAAERGMVPGGNVIYPDAIGSLGKLSDAYAQAIAEAGKSMRQLAASRLVARWNLFAEGAALDGPGIARLEVEIANPTAYPADNAQVEVRSAVPFSEDDVVQGREGLKGAAYLDGKLKLYLASMNASGKETIVFEKNSTPIRTVKASASASGFEDYSALVIENRDVSCDADVDGFYADPAWISATADGVPLVIADGFARKHLAAGVHVLQARYLKQDAYSREISGNQSTLIGERVYQKYQVAIAPGIDMDSLRTLAAIPQSPYVKEGKVITITGERIASVQTPEGFAVTVFGLKAGKPAKFEVSFYVDNSSQFAQGEIGKLSGLDLSQEVRGMVSDARAMLAANDSEGAAEKIRQAYEQIAQERVENAKLQEQQESGRAKVYAELAKLDGVLSGGHAGNRLTELLDARRSFLQDTLDSLEGKSLASQAAILNAYDAKWLAGQLRTYKKNASLEMNRAYSRFLDAGAQNSTLALRFSQARAAYNKFDAGNTLEDAYALADSLASVSEGMASLEAQIGAQAAELASKAEVLRDTFTDELKSYDEEYADAKGTRFEGIFAMDSDGAQAALKSMDAGLRTGNATAISKAYSRLSAFSQNVSATMDYLKGAAQRNSKQAKSAITAVSGKLSEKDFNSAASLASSLDDYTSKGQWVNALKAADSIVAIATPAESGGRYDIILYLGVVFVLGVVALYYYRGRKGGKQEKAFKKLEKAA